MNPRRWLIAVLGMAALTAVAVRAEAPAPWPFTDHQSCVAYRTHKDMMFAKDVEVVGQNCAVTASVERDMAAKRIRLNMTVPVKQFASGNWLRDRTVSEVLGGDDRAPVQFTSNWLPQEAFHALLAGGSADVGGELRIHGVPQAVSMSVSASPGDKGTLLKARTATTFSQLGVTVPTAGPGGIFARPKDDLELMGQFLFSLAENPPGEVKHE